MLVQFKKSKLVGQRTYAKGETAEFSDEVTKRLIKDKVVEATTDAVKPVKADPPAEEKPTEAKPAAESKKPDAKKK